MYKLFKEPDFVKFIAIHRLKLAGHLIKLDDNRVTKKVFVVRPYDIRKRGRPRLRRINCLEKDLKIIIDANESEDHVPTFVALPMRSDKGCVVDPPLEFKRIKFWRDDRSKSGDSEIGFKSKEDFPGVRRKNRG
ncbi:hypothetical protein TNCV_3538371 [Trichonephila clavipes]|nr:hypothetical protein TNCV_3538371 [Trichonephila clavipes]